jgi:putative oxidoreductase
MKWGKPEWAAIPLRLILGIILLVAGYFKLTQMTNTIAFFTKYGFPVPVATAWFIASLEFLGGAALIVGLFVRYLGILYTIEFIVASLWVQLPTQGYAQTRLLFMFIAAGLALYFLGAGPWSIDSTWIEKKHKRQA